MTNPVDKLPPEYTIVTTALLARVLGVSTAAVLMRIRRRTLPVPPLDMGGKLRGWPRREIADALAEKHAA